MNQIPSMWRVELLHPLTVHFPIGLLIVGAALRLAAASLATFRRSDSSKIDFIYSCSVLLNFLGTAAAWAAFITGDLAEDEVNSVLCDPTITHLHEDMALYSSLIFSAVATFDLAWFLGVRRGFAWLNRRALRFAVAIGAIAGAGLLGYVGHLGASLVYQQGAATYKPSAECTEFAE